MLLIANTHATCKKKIISCIFFLLVHLHVLAKNNTGCAVSYTFDGAGRFGDCVLLYCKAQYYATHYGFPLIYKCFPHSDKLYAHRYHQEYPYICKTPFAASKRVNSVIDIDSNDHNILYIVDLLTPLSDKPRIGISDGTTGPVGHWINFLTEEVHEKMLEDNTYKNTIKDMLRLCDPADVALPVSCVRLAVHVRTGGGYDGALLSENFKENAVTTSCRVPHVSQRIHDCVFPLRFPPLQFYIEQTNIFAEILDGYPLYIEIFTDDCDPIAILENFQSKCAGKNITICLGTKFPWYATPIDDLYRMAHFDCIIRPCSSYSGTAQLVGDYKIIMHPNDHCWDGNFLCIKESIMHIKLATGQYDKVKLAYKQPIESVLKNQIQALLCHKGI